MHTHILILQSDSIMRRFEFETSSLLCNCD